MAIIAVGELTRFAEWAHDAVVPFVAVSSEQVQKIEFEIFGSAHCTFYVADNEEMTSPVYLCRVPYDGVVSFSAVGTVYVQIKYEATTPANHRARVAFAARAQEVEQSEEVYTVVEPLGARRNTDLDRMMQMLKLNELRREQQMAEEIASIREEFLAQQALDDEAEFDPGEGGGSE